MLTCGLLSLAWRLQTAEHHDTADTACSGGSVASSPLPTSQYHSGLMHNDVSHCKRYLYMARWASSVAQDAKMWTCDQDKSSHQGLSGEELLNPLVSSCPKGWISCMFSSSGFLPHLTTGNILISRVFVWMHYDRVHSQMFLCIWNNILYACGKMIPKLSHQAAHIPSFILLSGKFLSRCLSLCVS